jgi:hypothetical protein
MFADHLMLDELEVVLTIDWNEHPDDVAQQMAAAFGNAVEEQRLSERLLVELAIFLVQRVRLQADPNHPHPGRVIRRTRHEKLQNLIGLQARRLFLLIRDAV